MGDLNIDSCPGWQPNWILWIQLWIFEIFAETLVYGIFTSAFIVSSAILIHQGLRSSSSRLTLFLLTTTMFTVSTTHIILHIIQIIIQPAYICNIDFLPPNLRKLLNATDVGMDLVERVQYFLSDLIVVWRAVAIWPGNRWVLSGLAFCMLATAVTSIYLAVLNILTSTIPHHYPTLEKNMLGTFALMFTNASATLVVAYKTWLYRRTVRNYLGSGSTRTRVEGVLMLLVESGMLYFGFWVLIAISDYGQFGNFSFDMFQPHISGLYPTLIVIAVSLKKTVPDTIYSKSRNDAAQRRPSLSTLRFNGIAGPTDRDDDEDSGRTSSTISSRVATEQVMKNS